MNELQCPHCGGYKVTGTKKHTKNEPASFGSKLGFSILVQFSVLIFAFLNGGFSLGIFVVDIIIVALIFLLHKKQVTTGFGFTCDLCGYYWDWYIGTPLPKANNVQPNLIAAGMIRLQQQEYQQKHGEIKCSGCGNTVLAGYSSCPYCGKSR